MALVGQARRNEVGLRRCQHVVEIGVGGRAIGRRAPLGSLRRAPDDADQLGIGTTGEHAGMLLTPGAGPHDRDAQTSGHAESPTTTTLPFWPATNRLPVIQTTTGPFANHPRN